MDSRALERPLLGSGPLGLMLTFVGKLQFEAPKYEANAPVATPKLWQRGRTPGSSCLAANQGDQQATESDSECDAYWKDVMLLHIFRGSGRRFGSAKDPTGANLPSGVARRNAFKSINLHPDGEPTPGVDANACLRDLGNVWISHHRNDDLTRRQWTSCPVRTRSFEVDVNLECEPPLRYTI
jgi:hypothetical protein